jgi:hypothetical protein
LSEEQVKEGVSMQAEGRQLVETVGIVTSYAVEFTTYTAIHQAKKRQGMHRENIAWFGWAFA